MVLAQKFAESVVEIGERQAGVPRTAPCVDVARQRAEEHLIDGGEEALDAAASARVSRRGKDQSHLDVDGDLFEVRRGEIAAVVS